MIDEEKIAFYLSKFKTLQLSDLFAIFQLAKMRKLSAGDVYIKDGTTHRKLTYLVKGLIRVYNVNDSGEEITIQLYWEDQFFASRHNVILHQPSPYIFQAVEDTELLEVDYDEMQALLDANPQYSGPRNYFTLQMLTDSMERVESFILLSPEERYLKLLNEKQDIMSRVPDKYIATMLGITPVSLSRIRKRIASRHK
ncbi:MAG: Crp/Fnr family transcriptional regulator [Sphingobacteriales bacterium]|nr:MAG: Crp/Fnr family transcriptional regulator [Sphingobacteriales bacterium]